MEQKAKEIQQSGRSFTQGAVGLRAKRSTLKSHEKKAMTPRIPKPPMDTKAASI